MIRRIVASVSAAVIGVVVKLASYAKREPVAVRGAILAVTNVLVGAGIVGPGLNEWTAIALAAFDAALIAEARRAVERA